MNAAPKSFLRAMALGTAIALAAPGISYGFAVDTEASQSYLQEAREYFEQQEFQAAVIELRNAIKADPNNLEARMLLTEIYLLAGQGIAAQTEIEDIRERGGDRGETALMLAKAFVLQQLFDEALAELDEVELPQEDQAASLVLRGDIAASLGNLESAEQNYVEAIEVESDNPEARLGLARLFLRLGRIDDAEARIDEALALEPTQAVLHHVKGLVARARGNEEAAAGHFTQSIELNPNAIAPLLDRAASFLDLGRLEEAQIDLDQVARLAPDNAMKEYLRAVLVTRQGDFEAAENILSNVGGALDQFLPALMLQGYVSYQTGNFERSATQLSRLVAQAPDYTPARQLYAATLLQTGNPSDAVVTLRPLLEKEETDSRTKVLAGTAFMQTGEFQRGVELYQQALEEAPDADALRTQLAVGRFALGETESARADLEFVIEQGNDPLRAAIMLTLIERQEGNFEDALESARRVIDLIPEQPIGYNLAGVVQVAAGNTEDAREYLRQALDKDQNYHVARNNLADMEAKQGNLDVAERELSYILNQDPDNINAMLNLARVMAAKENESRALELVERAVLQQPNAPQIREMLVEAHVRVEDMGAALQAAQDAERDFPNNPAITDLLGRVHMMRSEVDEAVSAFGRLVNQRPNDPQSYLRYGSAQRLAGFIESARLTLLRGIDVANEQESNLASQFLIELTRLEGAEGNFDEALGYFNELNERFPEIALNPLTHAQLLSNTGRYEDAIELYRSLLDDSSRDPVQVRGGLFQALRQAGRTEDALEMASRWVEEAPELDAARLFLADALLSLGRYDQAAEQYELLLQDDQEDPTILNNLAWSYHQMGQTRAVTYAERAYAAAPNSPEIADTLGWIILESDGDARRALGLIEEAALQLPSDREIGYHLAVALNAVGRKAEAREKLERLLDSAGTFSKREEARQLLASLND